MVEFSNGAFAAGTVGGANSEHSHDRFLKDTPRIYRNGVKRCLDVAMVVLSLPVVAPVIGLFALLLFLQDGKNPFYWQYRIGRAGRRFRFWKLRTMVPNAKDKLEAYLAANPAARVEWNATQKLKNDPRITPLGRFLRKTSLDELTQLWNVLVGDMSLVGPRPMMPEQVTLYPGHAYFQLRPGITGFWQISERNESSFSSRARYDGKYNTALSFYTDLTVLLRTFGVVVRATGH
ncbi:sugar transferase [Algicella marina]|uniref:Sugar transferase n=1 Tax=Algicella marina TaxID=2683284 RepID=A0A6P1SWQ5_9RHOB|nr:sugar transferase [Algicella marina]QHQ34090.1 sugar transferase [Algicella marina]